MSSMLLLKSTVVLTMVRRQLLRKKPGQSVCAAAQTPAPLATPQVPAAAWVLHPQEHGGDVKESEMLL